jgi:hypothetical protein
MSGRWLPTLPQVTAETVAVVLGAIIGAVIISQSPKLKKWIQDNYAGGQLVSGTPVTLTDQADQAVTGT